jgi:hypothetical protein
MKAHVIHEDENYWRGFICDKDSSSEIVQKYFPSRVTKYKRDPESVEEARDQARTVVTSNGDDFVRFIREAQKRSIFPRCDDCWGLVIIPNHDFQREYAFKKAAVKTGVLLGGRRLPWKAVLWANLCVRITSDGKVQVSKFERCEHCQRDLLINAGWYQRLPSLE